MKILLLDIESSPSIVYSWSLFNPILTPSHIVESGTILCYSAKWLDGKNIYFSSVQRQSSKKMLTSIHKLMDQADTIVHYNGLKYDIPTLNREFILHNLLPPADSKHVDLYQVVKRQFRFESNKLDWVCKQLGLGAKVVHRGMGLWRDCLAKKAFAWKEMEQYNRMDVALLERLYNKLLPWIKNHPNYGFFRISLDKIVCPNCGSEKLQKRGFLISGIGRYQRVQCGDCGKWSRGAVNLMTVNERKTVIRPI